MRSLLKLTMMALYLALASQAFALTGDAEQGEKKALTCGGCHGMDGNSAVPANPKLAGQSEKYLVKQLQEFKSGRRQNAVMAGFASALTDQDMADIAAYYASQVAQPGTAKTESIEVGQALYRGGNPEKGIAACTGCHGAKGYGLPEAGFPRLAGQHAAYTKAQLEAFRAAGREDLGAKAYRNNDSSNPEELGMMRGIAKKLSDKEIKALSEYIQGLY